MMMTPSDSELLNKARWYAAHLMASEQFQAYELVNQLISRLSAPPGEGQWVPKEPTKEMLIDGAARSRDFLSETGEYPRTKAVYKAMLAAAPHHSGAVVDEKDAERVRKELACEIVERLWSTNASSGDAAFAWREAVEDLLRINNYPRHPSSTGAEEPEEEEEYDDSPTPGIIAGAKLLDELRAKRDAVSPPSASAQGCEYDNQHCPKRKDETHCAHWWDGGPCCSCGHKGTDAVAKQWLESINEDGYRTDSERYAARHLLEMLAAQPSPPTTQEKAP